MNGNSLGCPELEQPWVRPDAMNAENLVEGVVVGKGRGRKLQKQRWADKRDVMDAVQRLRFKKREGARG